MSGITYVPLRNDLLVRLVKRDGEHYEGLIEYAVEDFLDRTEEDVANNAISSLGNGYVWDQVVLPENTELRTRYKGDWRIARLTSGSFIYEGNPYVSPAQACNAMRGDTSNNAWITLEIKRPQDVGFRLANNFRR